MYESENRPLTHIAFDSEKEISLPTDIPERFVNKIYLGDCMDMLRELPDNCIDLVVSSPPYNINKVKNDRKPLAEYLDWQRSVLMECHRVLKWSGSLFWQVGTFVDDDGYHLPLDIRFFPILEELRMIPRNRIVWIRPHGVHAQRKFSGRHETLLWFTKSMDYKFYLDPIKVPQKYSNKKYWKGEKKGGLSCDPLGKNPGDVWAFRNVRHNHDEDTIHPTQFPEDLIERIVLCTTLPGDRVLDPFMGVGTTAVVAKNFSRIFSGAEINEDYLSISEHRLSGEPDINRNFPNLKTLREYAKRNGISDVSGLTFTRQRKGSIPSLDSRANSEEYHNEEIIERIEYEAENTLYKTINSKTRENI